MSLEEFGTRGTLTAAELTDELDKLRVKLAERLEQYGFHSAASKHEILGLIMEEMDELNEAIRTTPNSGAQVDHLDRALIINELLDIAVAAIYGAASLRHQHTDW